MTGSRTLALSLLGLALAAAPLHAEGWLGLGAPAPAPEASTPSEAFLGLEAVEPRALPYVHPFATVARRGLPAGTLDTETTYLIRSRPGPAGALPNRLWVKHYRRALESAGFRMAGPVSTGGSDHAPLLTIARASGAAWSPDPESGLEAIPVDTAEVRLSLVALAEGEGSKEVPLFQGRPMPPAPALGRAAALLQRARARGAPRGQVGVEALRAEFPGAVEALGDFDELGLILAVRVLWRSGDERIPGPGGLLAAAVHPGLAHRRLQALYAHP